MTTNYHVSCDDGVWKVYKKGWTIPCTCADSKTQAVRFARSLARRSGGRVFVHRGDDVEEVETSARRSPSGSAA